MSTKFDYQEAITDADELITEFGMNAVLRREGFPDRPCRVAIVQYQPREKPSSLANPTDRKVIMSGSNIEVQTTPPDNELDQLVTFVQPAGTVIDEVLPMTCKPTKLAPAGVNVFWEFTVRQ